MPIAGGSIAAQIKYHYQDHDTDLLNEVPPVQNTWYEVFDAEDVRHLWCRVIQVNDELAAKAVEMRWTIDGNIYFSSTSIANNTARWVYRNYLSSGGGVAGLSFNADRVNAAEICDKRGHTYKVEFRMTSVPGTNQTLRCECVRETLEAT